MTTMAAAGTNTESLSWAASASFGRMCGSIWASAVLPALLEESTSNSTEEADEILPENANEEQRLLVRSADPYSMKNNERLLVRSADPYSNIISRKLIVRPPNTTLPSVPKMMNGA